MPTALDRLLPGMFNRPAVVAPVFSHGLLRNPGTRRGLRLQATTGRTQPYVNKSFHTYLLEKPISRAFLHEMHPNLTHVLDATPGSEQTGT